MNLETSREKQGPYNGKLSTMIDRLMSRINDPSWGFMFTQQPFFNDLGYLIDICHALMAPAQHGTGGIKIINLEELSSDQIPLFISQLMKLIFEVTRWTDSDHRFPLAVFCDEAHLYISDASREQNASDHIFERIAKEGRKYGLSLIAVTQRPSELNHTILSQGSNVAAMHLSNDKDRCAVQSALPENITDLVNQLPALEPGDVIFVGDASLLPCPVKLDPPAQAPDSATVEQWSIWSKERNTASDRFIDKAVISLCLQSR